MVSQVHFITSAPIEDFLRGYDIYDSFDLVSRGERVAHLVPGAAELVRSFKFDFPIKNITTIFTAPMGQTRATAELLISTGLTPYARVTLLDDLVGVRFSMPSLISKTEFVSLPFGEALAKARREFVIKLYHNELLDSIDSVRKRILGLIQHLSTAEGEVLCICHSFFLKLVEISIYQPLAWENLDKLLLAFGTPKRPFNFFTGFDFRVKQSVKNK